MKNITMQMRIIDNLWKISWERIEIFEHGLEEILKIKFHQKKTEKYENKIFIKTQRHLKDRKVGGDCNPACQ